MFKGIALTLALLVASQSAEAFLGKPSNFVTSSSNTYSATTSSSSSQLHLFGFLKEGKKALVKSIAGDYDETAINARIDNDISSNPVLMYSFTT